MLKLFSNLVSKVKKYKKMIGENKIKLRSTTDWEYNLAQDWITKNHPNCKLFSIRVYDSDEETFLNIELDSGLEFQLAYRTDIENE